MQAADRKGLLLSGPVLVVCVLFLGNAVAAAVRDRRRELAVLAYLGWPAGRLAAAIMGEVALPDLTIVVATHEHQVADRCDRVLRLHDGRLTADDR
ncbi:FtsX-like permease family protein [Actinoplanes sp. NPDC051470]|uniref:FtsX-like permease family protein n=1 Tax=Actinoplanes sp. NPDC051470 TaxID=3157224 RepID=UPI0034236771